MNSITITITGWVATEPRHIVGPSGSRVTSFRVASTARHFNQEKAEWEDGPTEWFTTRIHGAPGVTVHASIEKGQPVIITGALRTHQWESESGSRTDLIIDARAIGHDLTKGVANFRRATGTSVAGAPIVEDEPDEAATA